MKTIDLEEVKDNIAASCGYDDWNDLLKMHVKTTHNEGSAAYSRKALIDYENEAIEQYAKQRCDEQIKNIAADLLEKGYVQAVHDVLKNTPNVVTTNTK